MQICTIWTLYVITSCLNVQTQTCSFRCWFQSVRKDLPAYFVYIYTRFYCKSKFSVDHFILANSLNDIQICPCVRKGRRTLMFQVSITYWLVWCQVGSRVWRVLELAGAPTRFSASFYVGAGVGNSGHHHFTALKPIECVLMRPPSKLTNYVLHPYIRTRAHTRLHLLLDDTIT